MNSQRNISSQDTITICSNYSTLKIEPIGLPIMLSVIGAIRMYDDFESIHVQIDFVNN